MKAVLFDLFETLITEKTRPDFAARPSFAQRLAIAPEQVEQWWAAKGDACMVGRFPDCQSSFQDLCRAAGSPLAPAAIAAAAGEQEAWKRTVLATVDPQVEDLLKAIRARGFKTGLLSNALTEEMLAWEVCPLRQYMDEALFSCSSKAMKPQRAFYLEACRRLDVAVSQAYFVGDGGYDELRGARVAGLRPIQALWYADKKVAWPYDDELVQAESTAALLRLLGIH